MKLLTTVALVAIITSTASVAATSAGLAASPNITRQVALQRADRLFTLLDANHDGILTRDDARVTGSRLMAERIATGHDRAPGIGGHTLKYFEGALETRSSVDRRQFEQVMLAHFVQMDTNHDGLVSVAEREQARASRLEQRQGQ